MTIDFAKTFNDKKSLILWPLTVLLVIFALTFSMIKDDGDAKTSQKNRVASITKQLRCLECEGLSVYDSDTSVSVAIKKEVAKKVKEGKSDEEIISSFDETYGEFVRLSPTSNDGNWAIYVFPLIALIALIFAILIYTRKEHKYKILKNKFIINTRILFWICFLLIFSISAIAYKFDISNVDDKTAIAAKETTTGTTTEQDSADLENSLKNEVSANPTAANYRALGILQFAQENYLEALKNLDQAVTLDPTDATSAAYASYVVFSAKQYESAKTRATSALAADPGNVAALFFHGLILRESPTLSDTQLQANLLESNKNFDDVIALDPDGEFAQQINQIRS